MTRWLLLCITLISLPIVTDALVDYQFRNEHPDQNIGYSKRQVGSMDRLIDRVNSKAKKRLPAAEQHAAILYLYGDRQ